MTTHNRERITEPIFLCEDGTIRSDAEVGSLKVHVFQASPGAIEVAIPENSFFLINSPLTNTTNWNGERQRQKSYEAGDLQYMPAGSTITTVYTSRPINSTLIRIPDRLIETAASSLIDLSTIKPQFCFIPRNVAMGMGGAVHAIACAKLGGEFADPRIESLLEETFVLAYARGLMICKWGQTDERQPHQDSTGIRRAVELVEHSLGAAINLEHMASAAAMSPYHFARTFKAAKGTTPMRYVWQRRVERAREMLRNHEIPLSQVAQACGFSTQSHFSHTFKRAIGMTPREFRRVAQ